jgi:hypothetical protein
VKYIYQATDAIASCSRISTDSMFSSVWRSLLPVVEDNPFALLDPFSVVEEDLVETDRVSLISLGRMYNVKYNRDQKWYWLSKQTSDEVAIFVCFDSHPPDGILNCRLHPDRPSS